ncbi:MAG: DNA polymerase IV [Actinobacteria bacterium]|nr:DNA polymerase IV [Actinomycetota bacterium]
MDAFFAAVEIHDDPSLFGHEVLVGGTGGRGVVASCSYEARERGVRSGMAMAEARRRCPDAVVLPGRFGRYQEVSASLHAVLHSYTPLVEPIGLDEAFLDVSGAARLFGEPPELARALRAHVHKKLELWCSVGVGTSKLIAKLASRAAKPPSAGVFVVPAGRELDFLHRLPVNALWGVGPTTGSRLAGLGVRTVAELAEIPLQALERKVGKAAARTLFELARGVDHRPVVPTRQAKSIGHEETFAVDCRLAEPGERAFLENRLVRLADAVADRLSQEGLAARRVMLKLRLADLSHRTRATMLDRAVSDSIQIGRAANFLLSSSGIEAPIRLLGISVSALEGAHQEVQLPLFSEVGNRACHDLAGTVKAVRNRFGSAAIGPASLVRAGGLELKRRGETQWGPLEDHDKDG